jgi:hypothetical protein
VIKPSLIQGDDLTRLAKYKVRNSSRNDNLPQTHTSGRPHVNAIATATVDIAIDVHLDAVRYAVTGFRLVCEIHTERTCIFINI